ncbi:hypothetical protein REPUB_Repub08aG0220300 [Reevesia pubescens]
MAYWPLIGNMWHGETSIYKTSLFWNPTIIVCSPELCRKVLTDDEHFKSGYPFPSLILGGKPFDYITSSGHKRFRRLTTSRINGHESLTTFIECIEEIVITTLEELTKTNQPIQFSTEMNRIAFKVIMTIFLGSATDDSVVASMEKHYSCLFQGLFCTTVNIPGFAYHRALKARKMLVKIIQAVLVERREKESNDPNSKRGLVDLIKEVENEEGEKLDDEHIVIVLIVYLLAGRETMGRAATWATIYLYDNPKRVGSSSCPGADLAKLNISIFLHYFLLNYKLEQLNPGGPVNYLPSPDPADNCLAKIIKLH